VQGSFDIAVAQGRATLPAHVDLHARPAADFVRTAMRFSASIWVVSGDKEVDAKSLLSILSLGAKGGTTISLRAEGADASDAVDTLTTTVTSFTE
jgi:phosphocarrier protein HPr